MKILIKNVLFLFLLSGCSSFIDYQVLKVSSSSEVIYLEAGLTKVDSQVGEPIKIQIQSNPSTGFRWNLKIPAKLMDCFVIVKDGDFVPSFVSTTPTLRIVGAPESQEWLIETRCRGTYLLEWNSTRPWEKDVLPVATRQLQLFVR